jgi:hypothetical protein
MSELSSYIEQHVMRGECKCGSCCDSGNAPDPKGHTANVGFFTVAAADSPDAGEFKRLTKAHKGSFCDLDLFDGKEHNYMEIGGWIGDQGLALMFMGLGKLLGVFQLLTPAILGIKDDDPMFMQMAQMGFCSVVALPETKPIHL